MYDKDVLTYMLLRIKWNCSAMWNTTHTTMHYHWPLFTVADKLKRPVACVEKIGIVKISPRTVHNMLKRVCCTYIQEWLQPRKNKKEWRKKESTELMSRNNGWSFAAHWKDKKWENVTTACLSNAQGSVRVLHPPAVTVLKLITQQKKHKRPVMSSNYFQLGSIGAAFIQCEGKAFILCIIHRWSTVGLNCTSSYSAWREVQPEARTNDTSKYLAQKLR